MWHRRREDRRPARPIGQGIGDGDTVLMFGQTRRWSDLHDKFGAPRSTPPTELVRPYVPGSQIVDLAEQALRQFSDNPSREQAERLLGAWKHVDKLSGHEQAAVLARFRP
jgi:hypothetical protein